MLGQKKEPLLIYKKGVLMKVNGHQILILAATALLSAHIIQANVISIQSDEEFNQKVSSQKQPTLVQFSADWCGVCKNIKTPFEELSNEAEFNDILFVNVNVDDLKEASKKNGIIGVPTFLYVEDGVAKTQDIGVENMKTFKKTLANNIRKKFTLRKNSPLSSSIDASKATTLDAPIGQKEEDKAPVREETESMIKKAQAAFWAAVAKVKGWFGY